MSRVLVQNEGVEEMPITQGSHCEVKQLWILNHYAQEPSGAGGTRHYSLAKHLVRHGWRTTVIAASTDHKTGQQRLVSGLKQQSQAFEGFQFLWLKAPVYRGNGLDRVLNMLAFTWRVLLPSTTRQLPSPDMVIGSSVHPLAAWAGAVLAKRHNVPFIFEVRDLWPQTLIDMGRISSNGPVARALRRLEAYLYRRASRVLVLLPHADKYINRFGIDPRKIVWLPNGVELENYPALEAPQRRESFTLMYFGAHAQANGLDNILRAMMLVQSREDLQHVRLRMIGGGPLKSRLIALAKEIGLHRVDFEDAVPKQKIPSIAAEADAFIANLVDAPDLYKFGISLNKLYDYLAAARPIIFGGAASNDPVAESGAGLTVPPDDPEALADAIAQIVHMPIAQREAMGAAGRLYAENQHAFSSLAKKLVAELEVVCAERGVAD